MFRNLSPYPLPLLREGGAKVREGAKPLSKSLLGEGWIIKGESKRGEASLNK